jgi:hypothetical protein
LSLPRSASQLRVLTFVAIALTSCVTIEHSEVPGIRIVGDAKGWLNRERLEKPLPPKFKKSIPPYEVALSIYSPDKGQPSYPFAITLCMHVHEESRLRGIVLDETKTRLKAEEHVLPARLVKKSAPAVPYDWERRPSYTTTCIGVECFIGH